MLKASIEDTINMTGLETSGQHLEDKFIKIILGLCLAPGGQEKKTYGTLHKGWIMLWWSFIDSSLCASELDWEEYMSETEVN